MERIRQGMAGYRMPAYMEEILTGNYCPYFIRMSMVRRADDYSFSYRPDRFRRIEAGKLSTYEKLLLIKTIIWITEISREYLIRPEAYLLEPELIYSSGGRISVDNIRIMFYPDVKRLALRYKLVLFAERIKNKEDREEREIFSQMRAVIETGDMNKVKLFLDRKILRMEDRMRTESR